MKTGVRKSTAPCQIEPRAPRAAWVALLILAASLAFATGPSAAQPSDDSAPPTSNKGEAHKEDRGAIDALAHHLAKATERRWAGQRVPPPPPVARPNAEVSSTSLVQPLTVHGPADLNEAKLDRALQALEYAQVRLGEEGWGDPVVDGLGDPSAFDLYLVHGPPTAADARSDGRVPWSYLDAASAYAVVDADLEEEALPACVTAAYAQAVLLGLDPAEAETWRRATADWLAWRVSGRFGCDEAVRTQQREPWRSPIATAAGNGEGGAQWIAYLSSRHGKGSGSFVRDLWDLARQRTWDGFDLRGSPDLWEALEVAIELSGDDMTELVEDYAVARWFAGSEARQTHSPVEELAGLPSDAALSTYVDRIAWDELPEHGAIASPALQPFGTGYVIVDVAAAPPNATLRLWLRGEFGVRWSFVAFRLDARGRDIGRMADAPRLRNPHGYLPLALFQGTKQVVVAATNLSSRLPDADEPDSNARTFKVIAEGAAPAAPSP